MNDEKIIYCIVAETVQHPLTSTIIGNRLVRLDSTQDIVQTPGRLAAQACHAIRRMEHHRAIDAVCDLLSVPTNLRSLKRAISRLRDAVVYEPITTIVLSCRDSFELEHVYNLLSKADIVVYKFDDTNWDVYGAGEVTTAFATVPVDRLEILDILDYLPLWVPKP
jgi:peptidyl-tRNA hydrolase